MGVPVIPDPSTPVSVLSLWHGRILLPCTVTRRPGRTIEQIAEDVAQFYRITVVSMKGPARVRSVCRPRFEAMWLAYQERWPNGRRVYSLPQIGAYFGRDHTTVLNALKRHEERLGLSPPVEGRREAG